MGIAPFNNNYLKRIFVKQKKENNDNDNKDNNQIVYITFCMCSLYCYLHFLCYIKETN